MNGWMTLLCNVAWTDLPRVASVEPTTTKTTTAVQMNEFFWESVKNVVARADQVSLAGSENPRQVVNQRFLVRSIGFSWEPTAFEMPTFS